MAQKAKKPKEEIGLDQIISDDLDGFFIPSEKAVRIFQIARAMRYTGKPLTLPQSNTYAGELLNIMKGK